MLERLKLNSSAILVGCLIGFIFPILLILDTITQGNLGLVSKGYILTDLIGFKAGIMLTDFLLLFLAGFVAAKKSVDNKLLSSLAVGIIVPIVTSFLTWGVGFLDGQLVVTMFLFSLYALAGGALEVYLLPRIRKNSQIQ